MCVKSRCKLQHTVRDSIKQGVRHRLPCHCEIPFRARAHCLIGITCHCSPQRQNCLAPPGEFEECQPVQHMQLVDRARFSFASQRKLRPDMLLCFIESIPLNQVSSNDDFLRSSCSRSGGRLMNCRCGSLRATSAPRDSTCSGQNLHINISTKQCVVSQSFTFPARISPTSHMRWAYSELLYGGAGQRH